MNTADAYLGLALAVLFVSGISLLVVELRTPKRIRKQWGWRS